MMGDIQMRVVEQHLQAFLLDLLQDVLNANGPQQFTSQTLPCTLPKLWLSPMVNMA